MRISFLAVFVLFAFSGFAQVSFPTQGRLYFERKVGQITLIEINNKKEEASFWTEEFKKNFPRIITDYFILDFDKQHSYYKKEKENKENKYLIQLFNTPESDFVFQDLAGNTTTMSRLVFEKTYLVRDSLQKYDWKISGETRDIAGFECRKATAKIADSVVVVAFYTDQIPVSAGPENFNGLPGMILGVAVPRLALTLFATRLELTPPTLLSASLDSKSKKYVSRVTLESDMDKSVKDWGENANLFKWMTLL